MSLSLRRAGREAQVKVGTSLEDSRKPGGGKAGGTEPAAGFLALPGSSQLLRHLGAGNIHFLFSCIFSSIQTKMSPDL